MLPVFGVQPGLPPVLLEADEPILSVSGVLVPNKFPNRLKVRTLLERLDFSDASGAVPRTPRAVKAAAVAVEALHAWSSRTWPLDPDTLLLPLREALCGRADTRRDVGT